MHHVTREVIILLRESQATARTLDQQVGNRCKNLLECS
jgi:hypothetical protein